MTVLGALIQSFMQSSYIFNSVYGELHWCDVPVFVQCVWVRSGFDFELGLIYWPLGGSGNKKMTLH